MSEDYKGVTVFSAVQVGADNSGEDTPYAYFDKDGRQVVGDQFRAINDADGTDDTDTINEILEAMRSHGLIAEE